MKTAKMIVLVTIALLPVIAYVACIAGTIGNDVATQYVPMGDVQITNSADGYRIVCEPDTWAERLIAPVVGENALTGVFEPLARMLLFMQDNVGVNPSLPVVGSVLLLLYLAWVSLWDMLVNFITFVPRKCAEIFR